MPLEAERFEIARALAHGHVAAVLGTVRRLGLDKMLPKGPERRAKLILAMIVARIVEPAAKLATARQLSEATAAHSLGAVLGLGEVNKDELYAALDLLGRGHVSGGEKARIDGASVGESGTRSGASRPGPGRKEPVSHAAALAPAAQTRPAPPGRALPAAHDIEGVDLRAD